MGSYLFTKSLRKSLRLIAKYTRFTGSKQGECELLLAFVEAFFHHYQRGFQTAANSKIIFRCLKKASANINKLHEDIQADYTENFNNLLRQAILKFGNETQGEFSYF
jgi:urease accessory protein UreH